MKLDNKVNIPVIDPNGELLEVRELQNCPLPVLHADMMEEIVIIDWMGSTEERPTIERMDEPVWYKGKKYWGNKYWGSAVKTGSTIGVTKNFLDVNLVKKAEDGQRVQRYMLGQGHWGGVEDEFINVRVVKEGVTTQWGLVADGAGFISKKLADKGFNGLNKIKLGRARESYTFWQRIVWSDALEAEIMPYIKKAVEDAGDISKILTEYSPASFDDKKALYDVENMMAKHPYLVNSIARSSGETFARMATTANVGTKVGVAVPTQATCVIPEFIGRAGLYRHPIDSEGSMQAVNATKKEQKRVAETEVIQHTTSGVAMGKRFFAKGCYRIVDTDEFDILLCNEDIKMYGGDLEEIRDTFEFVLDGVVAFNQWYAKGSSVGVSPKFGKKRMGLDFDGDLVDWFNGDKHPVLWQTISEQPERYTDKLTKSTTGLDNRTNMIHKSMMNLVGMATKMATDTYLVQDREYLAMELGYPSLKKLDEILNYWIKVGTDGFKTDIDQAPIRSDMSVFQSKIHSMFGGSAPYSDWPNDHAFKRWVPQLFDESMDKEHAKESIKKHMNATIGQICRLTLHHLETLISEPYRAEPLTTFKPWVAQPVHAYQHYAKGLQDWYNARQGSVNWHDSDRIIEFKSKWVIHVEEFIVDEKLDRNLLARALWWVAHSARSSDSGAGSVFMVFQSECLEIVGDKVDITVNFETMFNGMHYQLPNVDNLEVEVEVVDFEEERRGKVFVRKAVVASVIGQLQPQNKQYPKDMIAMVAINANQPVAGKYLAHISRYSERAHLVTLDKTA